jgi:hypothetical protein
LEKLQAKGIWLLDASIVGLYRSGIKEYPGMLGRIIQTSWHGYVKNIVLDSAPRHVIIIGKAVEKVVGFSLLPDRPGYSDFEIWLYNTSGLLYLSGKNEEKGEAPCPKICSR